MKKVCFIGTSFLGAYQAGYSYIKEDFPEIQADFYGVDAPRFLLGIYREDYLIKDNGLFLGGGLPVFTRIDSFFNSETDNKTFDGMTRNRNCFIPLNNYDAIILVDFFFRFNRILGLSCQNSFLHFNDIPISDALLNELCLPGIGGWGFKDHINHGDVPFQKVGPLIEMIKHLNHKIFISPAPFPPYKNIENLYRNFGTDQIDFEFEYCKKLFRSEVDKLDISILNQDEKTMENSYSTKNMYSRGPHRKRKAFLDPHMNADFGKIQLAKILDSI